MKSLSCTIHNQPVLKPAVQNGNLFSTGIPYEGKYLEISALNTVDGSEIPNNHLLIV